VAVPVFGPREEVVAALSTVIPYGELDPRSLVPLLRAAARGLSRALGAPSASALAEPVRRSSLP
jgi:DNA-binding IclR family transcriptional regulator